MPFIHIKSLPFDQPFDVRRVVEGIGQDVAAEVGLPLKHVHTTWEFYLPGYYAKGNQAPESQPATSHPVIVDLLTPDFNDARTIERMLIAVAKCLAKRAGIPLSNIFINHRPAHSGMVFDDGDIVRW